MIDLERLFDRRPEGVQLRVASTHGGDLVYAYALETGAESVVACTYPPHADERARIRRVLDDVASRASA